MEHDILVVGGGSAGCVLAARLSERPDRRVLLVEAGSDYASAEATPADLLDGREVCFNPAYDWGYASEPDERGRAVQLYRGRVIGGCSAVNAAMALRGTPADYDAWTAAGSPGWSFADVLPFFKAAERDEDFDDEWHGRTGPLPVRRSAPAELSPLHRAFLEAAAARGHAEVADHNRPGAVGLGLAPRNLRGDTRMSTALTHLAAARGRPNLEIRSGCLVDRVLLRSDGAAGVVLAGGERVEAGLVVLAAGAYGSPAILLRSGIGPGEHLRSLGIAVEAELPGVGRGLADHPLWGLDQPYRGTVTPGHRYDAFLTMRSSLWEGEDGPDLHLWSVGPFEAPPPASPTGAVFGVVVSVVKPFSRGSLRLRSADPAAPPVIDPGYLRDPRDLPRAVEALHEARRLCRERPLADLIGGPELAPGPDVENDDALGAALRARVETYHHPVSTCRMGPDGDAGAVVDARGRVHGVDRLVVADASIMPELPAANTNLPTIMVAERIAAWLTT